jgi:hypothetical protein
MLSVIFDRCPFELQQRTTAMTPETETTRAALLRPLSPPLKLLVWLHVGLPLVMLPLVVPLCFQVAQLLRKLPTQIKNSQLLPWSLPMLFATFNGCHPQPRTRATAAHEAATSPTALLQLLAFQLELPVRLIPQT